MTKETLAQMLSFYASTKEKHHIIYVKTNIIIPTLSKEENLDLIITSASSCANTKVIMGKVKLGKEYIVSRGEELGFGLKPDAVAEYSSHWPWDYCYFYKI